MSIYQGRKYKMLPIGKAMRIKIISGTFRSKKSADCFALIRGYISTAKKQGVNILQAIRDAFSGNPFISFINNTG